MSDPPGEESTLELSSVICLGGESRPASGAKAEEPALLSSELCSTLLPSGLSGIASTTEMSPESSDLESEDSTVFGETSAGSPAPVGSKSPSFATANPKSCFNSGESETPVLGVESGESWSEGSALTGSGDLSAGGGLGSTGPKSEYISAK